jgi:hypothetical protein
MGNTGNPAHRRPAGTVPMRTLRHRARRRPGAACALLAAVCATVAVTANLAGHGIVYAAAGYLAVCYLGLAPLLAALARRRQDD